MPATPPASREKELLVAFELHSPERIEAALDGGLDARSPVLGKLPLHWLIETYTRSPRFPDCVRVLLDRGATCGDGLVDAVLLNDAAAVSRAASHDPEALRTRSTLPCAYTPLEGVSLLHVAAEFGAAGAARALLEAGADMESRASVDGWGFGGQTPIFHGVNSSQNHSAPVLRLLLAAGARTDVRLAGVTWGRGHEWETTLFDVTPLSYAQCGLLPQMHRNERDVYATLAMLVEAAGRPLPPLRNVPNRYLVPQAGA